MIAFNAFKVSALAPNFAPSGKKVQESSVHLEAAWKGEGEGGGEECVDREIRENLLTPPSFM